MGYIGGMASDLTPTPAERKALSTVRPAVLRQAAAQVTAPDRRSVRAVALSPREQGLLWSPGPNDAGATSYRVYRDGKPIAMVRDTTWFIDRKAEPGAEHKYEVRAVGTLGMDPAPGAAGAQATGAAGQAEAGAAMSEEEAAAAEAAAAQQPGAPQAGSQGAQQAAAGALPTPVPQGVKRDGDKFAVIWKPVQGAVQYGIYENGKLIGHTPDPLFGATAPPGVEGVVLEVDAVDAQGKRSARTKPIPIDMRPGAGQQPGQAQGQQEGQQQGQAGAAPADGQQQAPAQQQQQAQPGQPAQQQAQPTTQTVPMQPQPVAQQQQQQAPSQQSAIQRQAAAQQAAIAQQQQQQAVAAQQQGQAPAAPRQSAFAAPADG